MILIELIEAMYFLTADWCNVSLVTHSKGSSNDVYNQHELQRKANKNRNSRLLFASLCNVKNICNCVTSSEVCLFFSCTFLAAKLWRCLNRHWNKNSRHEEAFTEDNRQKKSFFRFYLTSLFDFYHQETFSKLAANNQLLLSIKSVVAIQMSFKKSPSHE